MFKQLKSRVYSIFTTFGVCLKIFDFTDLQIKDNELKTNIAAQLCSMAVEKDVLDGKPCWKAFLLNFTAASKQSKTLVEKVCNSIGQN